MIIILIQIFYYLRNKKIIFIKPYILLGLIFFLGCNNTEEHSEKEISDSFNNSSTIVSKINSQENQNSDKTDNSDKKNLNALFSKYAFKIYETNPEFVKSPDNSVVPIEYYKKIQKGEIDVGGGNLNKFKEWSQKKEWDKIRSSHYDWWMFPNDRKTSGQGMKYCFTKSLINKLIEDQEFIKNYILGIKLVLLAWGWDFDKNKWIQNPDQNQKWDGYEVRLLKIIYSTILMKHYSAYKSVKIFAKAIINKQGKPFSQQRKINNYIKEY